MRAFRKSILPEIECSCQQASLTSEDRLAEEFQNLRDHCPALKHLLVPDWSTFEAADTRLEGNEATHRSILLLAFERGHLNRITSPIHRYLMSLGAVKKTVIKQYRQDLPENWLHKEDALDRHRRSKAFMGKLVELQCAEWLEREGWRIRNLAALGGKSDIEAICPECSEWAIEVKLIDVEDWDFLDVLKSLKGIGTGRSFSMPTVADWLLFKVYTAAKQLSERSRDCRCALIAIEDRTWPNFRFALENNFIDWGHACFSSKERKWLEFLEDQKRRYPEIEEEVGVLVKSLSKIWIFKLADGFDYSSEYTFP